jgi:RNA polymerase sigma-70 factor (ECF subfamily)
VTTDERAQRFRLLYDGTRARVLAYALRRTASPEDAADAVAETFAIAWRRLDDIQDEVSLIWLYGTCRRVIANHHRRVRRRSELVERIGAQLGTAVNDRSDAGVDAMTALLALEALSDDDREMLMLVGWEGLDSADLARCLGCSPTAARIRLHRARARLTEEMQRLGLAAKQAAAPRHLPTGQHTPRETPKGGMRS